MLHFLPSAVNDDQTTARPSVILATLAAVAIALAVCATAATVIVASDVSRERSKVQTFEIPNEKSAAEAQAAFTAIAGIGEAVDSLVAPLAPFTPIDSVTLRLISNQWRPHQAEPGIFLSLPDSLRPADPPLASLAEVTRQLGALRNNLSRGFPGAFAIDSGGDLVIDSVLFAVVARDTVSSWLGVWRSFARSEQLPALWGFRDGFPNVSNRYELAQRPAKGILHLSQLNEFAGLLALNRGDAHTALARGLENIAASRHFLDSPLMSDFLVGRTLATDAVGLSRAAAIALGDSALLLNLSALNALAGADRSSFLALYRNAERDAADPEAPVVMELFDDEKLPFAVRVEILYALVQGACGHTREVLFGFAPEREARLQLLADRYLSHATLGPVLQVMPARARQIREDPASLLSGPRWPTRGTLDFLLPEGVAERAVGCQQGF